MIAHYPVDLETGVRKRLSDFLGTGFTTPGKESKDILVDNIVFSAHFENTAVIYIGNADVSATNYLFRIEIPASSIPSAPIIWDHRSRNVRPSDFYALGTTGDMLIFGFAQ